MVGAADFLKNVDAGSNALQSAAGSGAAGLVKRAAQAACDAARTNVSDAILNPAGKAFAEGLCGDYWASTGTAPKIEPAFLGGQCPGVLYTVTMTMTGNLPTGPFSNDVQLSGTNRISGPIATIEIVGGGSTPYKARAVNAAGASRFFTRVSNGNVWEVSGGATDVQFSRPLITGADNSCGSRPPSFTPGTGPTIEYGDTINYDIGGGVTIPIIPIVPVVNVDGTISIPVDVGGVTLEFGNGDSGAGDAGNLNPNVGPEVTASEPSAGLIGDNEFGSPPERHQWVGFQVVLADQGVTNGLYPNSEPDAVYRAPAGVARAIYSIGGNRVLGTAFPLNGETTTRLLELPGLTLVGCRVSIPSNDVYTVIKLSQPIEE